ncbi:MAG: hypothetical protein BWY94_02212 [Actinobacteria bacterium ADurb.BinA094]|nr:MAG: hypothetical protein BWY94_02212 [Actinobacteria bacterium ADurb.BinA094]
MVSAIWLTRLPSKSYVVSNSYMMYALVMSGSKLATCGSTVSLAEPPTMPILRSPPFFGSPEGVPSSPVEASPPQADAIGPSAATAPMAAAPLSRLRRETGLFTTSRSSPTSNQELSLFPPTILPLSSPLSSTRDGAPDGRSTDGEARRTRTDPLRRSPHQPGRPPRIYHLRAQSSTWVVGNPARSRCCRSAAVPRDSPRNRPVLQAKGGLERADGVYLCREGLRRGRPRGPASVAARRARAS